MLGVDESGVFYWQTDDGVCVSLSSLPGDVLEKILSEIQQASPPYKEDTQPSVFRELRGAVWQEKTRRETERRRAEFQQRIDALVLASKKPVPEPPVEVGQRAIKVDGPV